MDIENNTQALIEIINTTEALKVRTKALANMTHQVYSQHLGSFLGGKATVVITFDDEPRMTRKEFENINQTIRRTEL